MSGDRDDPAARGDAAPRGDGGRAADRGRARVGKASRSSLKSSINAVNEAQTTASDMAAALERGDKSVALPEVMIALQKASLSFQAMTEVRNRLVNAYQEIMNMPI